jgi:hypothetical protein
MMEESIFDDKMVKIDNPLLGAIGIYNNLPTKHEMQEIRANTLKAMLANMKPLEAYVIFKSIEKLVVDKDEGLIKQLKDKAVTSFKEDFPFEKSATVLGAKVGYSARSYFTYSAELQVEEHAIDVKYEELKKKKKIEELNGTATKGEGTPTLTITF